MLTFLTLVLMQTGIDAGPAGFSCDQSLTTLVATPIDPPANYQVQWVGAAEPGIFFVVQPSETTEYRVQLTDLDTQAVYEDTTWVLVHTENTDLDLSGDHDYEDWKILAGHWYNAAADVLYDPNGDGLVNLLDWFYFCNFEFQPENTPPFLTLTRTEYETSENLGVTVRYTIGDEDLDQFPRLVFLEQPEHGSAIDINQEIRYFPDKGFIGIDRFTVAATDGFLTTEPITVQVTVFRAETWADIKADILDVHCEACHISAAEGGLSLNTYELALAGGNSGRPGFVAGEPGQSLIYTRVSANEMPPSDAAPPLNDVEKERIRMWILRGAAE